MYKLVTELLLVVFVMVHVSVTRNEINLISDALKIYLGAYDSTLTKTLIYDLMYKIYNAPELYDKTGIKDFALKLGIIKEPKPRKKRT